MYLDIIQEKTQHVLLQQEKSSLKDMDNLPVEAFYCTALKLNELGEKVFVEVIAANALKMIGELRSIRKEYFQKVLIKPEVNKL